MAVPDHSIDPRIIESAKKEFLMNGYEKASLKAICENARITTGALYKRYKGKEDLFCTVVADTVEDMNTVVERKTAANPAELSDKELVEAWDMDNGQMLLWFEFMYERQEGFYLLLACAQGTVYSNFEHDWAEKMTQESWLYLEEAQKRNLTEFTTSREELHILLSAHWETVYEPIIHRFSWEQIEAHSKRVCRLFNWKGALGLRIS